MVKRIQKVAVIGSGIMGGGIAALCAGAGIPAILLDIVPFDLKDDEKKNPAARNRIVNAGKEGILKAKPALLYDKDKAPGLIQVGNLEDDFGKLADCDWIVEVVVENLKIKQELFARIEKVAKKDAIISTNTSGLPLNKIAQGRSKAFKERFLGTLRPRNEKRKRKVCQALCPSGSVMAFLCRRVEENPIQMGTTPGTSPPVD